MMLHRALQLMLEAHAGQNRDGEFPLPYATHPVDVTNKLRYIGCVTDDAMLIAALLHDTLEETDLGLESIRTAFGDRVAELVSELTREEPAEGLTAGLDEGEIWNLRSDMLMREISAMSPDAQAIKLADRLSNLESARATRGSKKYARYLAQTERMLKVIPESVNKPLHKAVTRWVEKT